MLRWFKFHGFCAAAGLLLSIPLAAQIGMTDRNFLADRPLLDSPIIDRPESPGVVDEAQRLGYPQDWSSSHLLMPGVRAEDVLAAADHDPRYVYNRVMRQRAVQQYLRGVDFQRPTTPRIDWAVSLENGYVPQNQYPAKYQFNVSADNCTADYIIFGLTVTSGTQANLVGINELYTGGTLNCNSGNPSVAFAYNTVTQTGGQIKTSPTISENGKMVAFIESTTSGSYFHVLVLPNPIPAPASAVGTVLKPQTPTSCTTPTTVGCMTTLTIQTSASDSNSSPWIDYVADTAYVATDNGILYKITPVFGGGAPALVTDSANWPVAVSTNKYNNVLTAPIVDDSAGLIFLGDGEGYLYSVALKSPAKTVSATYTVGWAYDGSTDGSGDSGTGVVDAPIVITDPANTATDQVFAFTGCSYFLNYGGAITQVPANFTTGPSSNSNPTNTANLGSASGDGDCTGENVHAGAFDNAFWVNGSTSGHIIACGFVNNGGVGAQAEMYMFPFSSHVISGTATATFPITTTKGAAEECSPLTEFYNGTSDMLFFGIGSTTATSYVQSSTLTTGSPYMTTPSCATTPSSTCVTSTEALGGTSGIVIDNELSNGGTNIYFSTLANGSVNSQKCNVTGGAANPHCAVKLTQSGLQ
jgi:hypothetical protein